MIFLRSAVFNIFFFAVTFVMTVFPATYVRLVVPGRMLELAAVWARIMLWGLRTICGIRVEVSGLEYLAGSEARLIASQHQSAFDTIVWLNLLPRCCYVVKHELVRIPLFGGLLPLGGMITVDRAGGAAALRALVRAGAQAAAEGRQIVIFPEGTRGTPGSALPLQPGIAALAARTGLPVFPVVTDSGLRWGRRAFHKRPGIIHVRVLPPIPAGMRRGQFMERLTTALRQDPAPVRYPVENSVG